MGTLGSFITGTIVDGLTYWVDGVKFSNVSLNNSGGVNSVPANPAEYNGEYPDIRWYWGSDLPAYGLYFRHTHNLSISQVMLSTTSPDVRPAIIREDVTIQAKSIKAICADSVVGQNTSTQIKVIEYDSLGVAIDTTAQGYAYSSLDPLVASVSASGVVTALAVGTARIVAAAGILSDTLSIRVIASATVDLFPMADSYVRGGASGSQNFGSDTVLAVKTHPTDSSYTRMVYFKFDLRGHLAADIKTATLKLFVDSNSFTNNNPMPVSVYGVADTGWGETSLTWNNRPALGSVLDTVTLASDQKNLYCAWDVTPWAKAACATGGEMSLALKDPSGTANFIGMASREYAVPAKRPLLQIQSDPQVVAQTRAILPSRLSLNVAPNPFSGNARISLMLPVRTAVQLDVYTISGKRVRTIAGGSMECGAHILAWDGRDNGGRLAPTGIYLFRLKAEGKVLKQRVNLIR
jgi:hypothetical protein